MTGKPEEHSTLWKVGSQSIQVAFDGGRIVSDAGLLAVRALEKPLRVIAELAERLPDPRSPKFIIHSAEALLTQEVYQILAGYPDGNDAQVLRDDPLFQILADATPDADHPLASSSTLTRFQYAYTRRQAELPLEERPVLLEMRAAQTSRIRILNDYLVDLFIRTRRTPPAEITLDADASDDPVHGHQALSGYHGYYRQHQYLPLFVYDGASGFPLAAWLRPGTVHASLGAVAILDAIVTKIEVTPQGSQRRFVVTNLDDTPEVVYRDFYVQRGRVPEQPIGEMKNGLQADRLSACGFCANSMRLLVHTLAYAIVVLFREAAAAVPEVATATVSTLRQRLWKVGAIVTTGVRRICLHFSETWPNRDCWAEVLAGVRAFVSLLQREPSAAGGAAGDQPM